MTTPDVKLPIDDPHEMDNLLKREWADRNYVLSVDRDTAALRDMGQIAVNVDHALDHYPLGRRRRENTDYEMAQLGYGRWFPRGMAELAIRKLTEDDEED